MYMQNIVRDIGVILMNEDSIKLDAGFFFQSIAMSDSRQRNRYYNEEDGQKDTSFPRMVGTSYC